MPRQGYHQKQADPAVLAPSRCRDDGADYLRPLVCPDTGEQFADAAEAYAHVFRQFPAATCRGIVEAARDKKGRVAAGRYWDFRWPTPGDLRQEYGWRCACGRCWPARLALADTSSSFVVLSRMNSAHARGEHYAGGVE